MTRDSLFCLTQHNFHQNVEIFLLNKTQYLQLVAGGRCLQRETADTSVLSLCDDLVLRSVKVGRELERVSAKASPALACHSMADAQIIVKRLRNHLLGFEEFVIFALQRLETVARSLVVKLLE